MSLSQSDGEQSKTKLIVVSKKDGKFYVKFPRLEVLVEMTTQYFHELVATGNYSIQYSLNYAAL